MVMRRVRSNRKGIVYGFETIYIFVDFKGFVISLEIWWAHNFISVETTINIVWATHYFT